MAAAAVSADLPLYLQMERYAKGSKALFELRTASFRANEASKNPETQPNSTIHATRADPDADIVTGSITDDDGFSFDTLLDMVNPLQHIPGVSTLYRELTGDKLDPAARVIGGALFGGPLGAGLSLMESVMEQATGLDLAGNIGAWFGEDSPANNRQTATGTGDPPAPQAAPASLASADTKTPAPLPVLSTEMFNALLTEPQDTSVASLPQRSGLPGQTAPVPTPIAPLDPEGFAAAMALGLERYKAIDDK